MKVKSIGIGIVALAMATVPALCQIKAGRAVQIEIKGVKPEEQARIAGMYPVSEDGTVNMPYVGPVKAAGLTAAALQVALEKIYEEQGIYTNPTFHVVDSDVQKIDQEVIHIGGKVKQSGPVKFTPGLTVYQAILAAGGPTEFGSLRRVKLFRDGRFSQLDLTKAEDLRVKLKAGDTVEVPRKDWLSR